MSIVILLTEIPLEEQRRVFDVNYWGMVHGSLVAVGAGGQLVAALGKVAPRLTDKIMERYMHDLQQMDRPPGDRDHHNLFRPIENGSERGDYPHHVFERSLYTKATLHATMTGLSALGIGAATALLWWYSRDAGGRRDGTASMRCGAGVSSGRASSHRPWPLRRAECITHVSIVIESHGLPPQDLRVRLSRIPAIPESRFVMTGVRRTE